MPLKVLHLVDHLNEYCGMSLSTINMITACRGQGYQGKILSGVGTAFSQAQKKGIAVEEFGHFGKQKSIANFWNIALDIDRIVKENNIDLLHAHHRWLGFIGWFVARWNSIPIVHSDHNLLRGNRYFSYWGDGVIADSEANKKHLENYFHIKEERITTCYAFADLKYLMDHPIAATEQYTHFGQIARLNEQKGQKYLIKGFSDYLKIAPRAQLTIKGEGPLKQPLLKQVHDLGIENQVHFEAADHDIYAFFEKIDCFIISSVFEGSCMAAVEAAAFGLPIISTDVGGIKNYLQDNINAVLIKHGSSAEITAGLKRMEAVGAARRQKMATRARAAVEAIFDHERQAEIIDKAYKKALYKFS